MFRTTQPSIEKYDTFNGKYNGWRASIGYRRKANVKKYERIKSIVLTTKQAAIEEGEFMKIILEAFGKSEFNKCRRPMEDSIRRTYLSTQDQYKTFVAHRLDEKNQLASLKLEWVTCDNIGENSDKRIAECLVEKHLWQKLLFNRKIYWFPPYSNLLCFDGLQAVRYHVKYFDFIIEKPNNCLYGSPMPAVFGSNTTVREAKYCGGRIMEPLELTVKRMKQVMSRN